MLIFRELLLTIYSYNFETNPKCHSIFAENFSCLCKTRKKKLQKRGKMLNCKFYHYFRWIRNPLGGCFVIYTTKEKNFMKFDGGNHESLLKIGIARPSRKMSRGHLEKSRKAISKNRKINWWNVNSSSASSTSKRGPEHWFLQSAINYWT